LGGLLRNHATSALPASVGLPRKSLLPKISHIVASDFRLMAGDFPVINLELAHRLAGLTIPQLISGPIEWELWVEPIDTSNWGYTIIVDMIDDVPQPAIGFSAWLDTPPA
jgi:hypothetical protein